VLRWSVQFLLILSVVAQGGCLRACQLQRMIVCDGDDDARTPATLTDSAEAATAAVCTAGTVDPGSNNQSDDKSSPCSCEFRNGLAQPDRAGADVPVLALVCMFWAPGHFDTACLPTAAIQPSQLPAVKLISHSPPLLI
jgi:hypothetical protein